MLIQQICLTKLEFYYKLLLNNDKMIYLFQNMDAAILKRVARVFKTNEFRFKVPEALMEGTQIVYNPKSGLDIDMKETENECKFDVDANHIFS